MGLLLGGLGAAGGMAAGGGIGIGTILSGVASVFSIMAGMQASESQAQSFEFQAHEAEDQQAAKTNEGVADVTTLKVALLKAIGENDVAFASAGIDLGFGIAADRRAKLTADNASDIDISRQQTDAEKAMLRARAANYYRLAADTRSQGQLKAIGGAFGAIASLV